MVAVSQGPAGEGAKRNDFAPARPAQLIPFHKTPLGVQATT
jgi:hypothetical protein